MKKLCALILLLAGSIGHSATVIADESLIPVPGIATNSSYVNWRPAPGSVQTLNPPIFMWDYQGHETIGTDDNKVRSFLLEVSYTNFGALAFSKLTSLNFFNALAPFTNSTSPIYWRVTFYTNGVQERVSNVRSFSITNSPTYWDRSKLDSDSYLSSKTTHPYLWGITAASRLSISNYLVTNDSLGMWFYIRQNATNYLNILSNAGWASIVPTAENRASYENCFQNLALMWQMTRQPIWVTNGGVSIAEPFNVYVNYYITNKIWSEDYYYNGSSDAALGYGFDWLYDILATHQRSNAVVAIDLAWQGSRGHFWRDVYDRTWGGYASVPTFTNYWLEGMSSNLNYGSAFMVGSAHPMVQSHHATIAMMAGVTENTNIQAGWRRYVNYMMSKAYPYSVLGGSSQGRNYAQAGTAESQDNYFPLFHQLQIAFPELGMTNTPWLQKTADWWVYNTPVGHDRVMDPWGDTGALPFKWVGKDQMGKSLAMAAQHGGLFASFLGQSNVVRVNTTEDPWSVAGIPFQLLLAGYSIPIPVPNTNLPRYAVMPEDGFVFSASGSPAIESTFTNGTWSVLMASPAGIEANHAYFNHGNFEMSAYGAIISRGGNDGIGPGRPPWTHNVVVPRGLGQWTRQTSPEYPVPARIIAFTNDGLNFTYAAVDTTLTYKATESPQGQSTPPSYTAANQLVGGLNTNRDISLVERHFLHMRGKYWVVYDKLRTDGTKSITWALPYQVENNSRPVLPLLTNVLPTLASNEFWLGYNYRSNQNLAVVTNALTGTNVYYSGRIGVTNCFDLSPWSFFYLRTNRLGATVRVHVVSIATNGLNRYTAHRDNVMRNPITGEDQFTTESQDGYPQAGAVAWLSNAVAQSNWSFVTVIYPVKPGDADPTILRLSDYSVAVTNGSGTEGDVITFDPNANNALGMTVTVNASAQAFTGVSRIISGATIRAGTVR